MCNVIRTQEHLQNLLDAFEIKAYDTGSHTDNSKEALYAELCKSLFKLDYNITEIDNTNGALCTRYPACIFIPESETGHSPATFSPNNGKNGNNVKSGTTAASGNASPPALINDPSSGLSNKVANELLQQQQQQRTIYEDFYDMNRVRDLISVAKYARCRNRFCVPVIMYRGKYICRSATISVKPETYGRKVVDFAYDCFSGTNNATNNEDDNNEMADVSLSNTSESLPFSYDEAIKSDIQLMNALNVNTIVDLMVEKRKIKYFLTVSSSEKADIENRYESFNLLSLPYPGCEFFKQFKDNNYTAINLHYDWHLAFNDAILSLPNVGPASSLDIMWDDYKTWNVVLLTQNYLKLILKYIQDESSGLLIHCISGWDRTPLFVSLVRLSLWADGLIHQSLNPEQITFFTIAYDWYLFGHQLPDRLRRGEDILFFLFHIVKFVMGDEFSIAERRRRTKTSSSSGSSVIILKSDCDDELKDDSFVNVDQDSNDSIGLSCDISLTDRCTPPPTNALTNRSPNSKRMKTSPISVPGGGARRQRHDSTSSTGSWQVVTETGSIESVKNGSYMKNACSPHDAELSANGSNPGNGTNNGSNGSAQEQSNNGKPPLTLRQLRLTKARAAFIHAYSRTVGLDN